MLTHFEARTSSASLRGLRKMLQHVRQLHFSVPRSINPGVECVRAVHCGVNATPAAGSELRYLETGWSGRFIDQTGADVESVYGGQFQDDRGGLALKHDRRGLLSAANRGPSAHRAALAVLST